MTTYVRKSMVLCNVQFKADDGSTTQPSSANIVLNFQDLNCVDHQVELPMIYTGGGDGVIGTWQAEWDSSASGEGPVFWMAYGVGPLQAAVQGMFYVIANPANNV